MEVVETILSIGWFEKECVILNRVFKSEQPKQHMVAIGVYQLLSNSAMYELSCLENVKKLYKYSGKCDDQQQ